MVKCDELDIEKTRDFLHSDKALCSTEDCSFEYFYKVSKHDRYDRVNLIKIRK